MLKHRVAIVLILLSILLLSLCSSCNSSADPDAVLDFSSDGLLVVTRVEGTHPVFLMGEEPENYDAVRAAYLETVAKPMKKTDFLLATQKYLVVLGDGHMGGGLIRSSRFIDVEWICIDDRLYLLDEEGEVTDIEVIRIGSIPVNDVQEQVDTYYFAENDSAKQRQYGTYCRQEEMLALAGCLYADTIEIETRDSAGEESRLECEFLTTDSLRLYYGASHRYIVKHEMLGDVFYIDLRTFRESRDVTNTCKAIRDAISEGTSKFIIDVRGNGGGNSNVGVELLTAMEMAPPSYGIYICASELSKQQRGATGNEQVVHHPPNVGTAKRNGDVDLVVLTDRVTFSSATMLGVWVQDGRLGTVIGQPSSNSPTCYGDMLSLRLPTAGIDLRISYKKFLRPDKNADQETLVPDIITGFDEDALEVALEYLRDK